jgi:23S rRNA (guanine745-N1)-methyltransferase
MTSSESGPSARAVPTYCSWSGGKDSALALHHALGEGAEPGLLVTMLTEGGERSRSHGLRRELLEAQAEALDVPIEFAATSWDGYEEALRGRLAEAARRGLRTGIFGDIDIDAHREWVEAIAASVGTEAWLPLWQRSRESLMRELLDLGFRAVIVAVRDGVLPPSLLGEVIDEAMLDRFAAAGVDLAGENGEFHTFVVDGPIFSHPVEVDAGERSLRDGVWFVDLAATPPTRSGGPSTGRPTPASDSALDLVLPILRCPVCGEKMARVGSSLRCPERHSFDIARQGYASLLSDGRARSGDDAAMARARIGFLAAGHFGPLRDALAGLAARPAPSPATVLEVGCGTGYHLAGVLDALPDALGLGLDSSVRALRAAAKAHPRAAAATWDVFRPFPIASASVDLVLDVFAPRNPAEFQRVLRPDGRLIVARPDAGHLAELRRRVERMVDVDPDKEERLTRALDPHFELVETERISYTASLTHEEAVDLMLMSPSAHHLSTEDLAGIEPGDLPSEVAISVLASAYRPRPADPT